MTRLGDFTSQADAYARSRPSYPRGLVERLVARAGVRPGDPVAELAAGTGLFTEHIAGRGLSITAIEPNASMREQAPRLAGVDWRTGTFEDTGLAEGSQRWAVAAQAFHWADPDRALPEMRRILAPDRRFSVLWNDRDPSRSDVVAWTQDEIRARVPTFEEAYRDCDWASILTRTSDFADPLADEELHVVRMSAARYVDLWRSHNRLSFTAGPEAMRALVESIAAHLARERCSEVEVPYVCRAWTVRRVG